MIRGACLLRSSNRCAIRSSSSIRCFVPSGWIVIGSLAFLGPVGRGLGASERQDPGPIRSSGDQSRCPLLHCSPSACAMPAHLRHRTPGRTGYRCARRHPQPGHTSHNFTRRNRSGIAATSTVTVCPPSPSRCATLGPSTAIRSMRRRIRARRRLPIDEHFVSLAAIVPAARGGVGRGR